MKPYQYCQEAPHVCILQFCKHDHNKDNIIISSNKNKNISGDKSNKCSNVGFQKMNWFREIIQEPGYLDSNQFVCLRSLSLCAAIRCGQSFCKIKRRKNAKHHFWKVKVQDVRRDHVICNYIDWFFNSKMCLTKQTKLSVALSWVAWNHDGIKIEFVKKLLAIVLLGILANMPNKFWQFC